MLRGFRLRALRRGRPETRAASVESRKWSAAHVPIISNVAAVRVSC